MAKVVPTSQGGTEGSTDKKSIINTLSTYWHEADNARRSGPNPRDAKWQENLDLYWNRYDFTKKANWQAQVAMPEVPNFVDRFASAMKEAMVAVPEGFYTVQDPGDEEGDLTTKLKAMLDVWLSTSGTDAMGRPIGFPAVFEEQMKLGAILACSGCVEWKRDTKYGRVTLDAVDPRFVWMDHTGRAMYRIRRYDKDRSDLKQMLAMKDNKGDSIFDMESMGSLIGHMEMNDQMYREQLGGHGQMTTSPRDPITFDEYYATIIGSDGKPMYDGRQLCTMAQRQFLVRGPEANPYWHGQDWMVYAPLITVPLSVYGRSYMEDFGAVARAYTELTNLLLDAVFTSSLKAFVMVPGLLLNPQQATEGIHPNKQFFLEEGVQPKDFAHALDLGNLPPESIAMWQNLKNELREAANMNEIGLGQFAPNGRTSATEVSATQQSSSQVIRSIAQTVETRFLEPVLDLMWKTGLQFMSKDDKMLQKAAGQQMFQALYDRRRELVSASPTFQARGISTLIQKQQKFRTIISLLQIIASNPIMTQAFFQSIDVRRFVALLFQLSDIDITKMQASARDQMIQSITSQLGQAQANAGPAPANGQMTPAAAEAGNVAKLLGVSRGG